MRNNQLHHTRTPQRPLLIEKAIDVLFYLATSILNGACSREVRDFVSGYDPP
jgi:hypothetical protein